MSKERNEYKAQIIGMAIQLSKKDSSVPYSEERLVEIIRSKIELTGDGERDINNCLAIIKELAKDFSRGYL